MREFSRVFASFFDDDVCFGQVGRADGDAGARVASKGDTVVGGFGVVDAGSRIGATDTDGGSRRRGD